jgi:hypothetical protein
MFDKTGKVLLALIALGLWVNIGISLFRPVTATAQGYELSSIRNDVSSLNLQLREIAKGKCSNAKICDARSQ